MQAEKQPSPKPPVAVASRQRRLAPAFGPTSGAVVETTPDLARAMRVSGASLLPTPIWSPAQLRAAALTPARTGLPDRLKAGVEALSGISMDHVRVHYNSADPAKLGALAYAQGADIHVAPGQERHLPHEAWHVVQQAQGRVRASRQTKTGEPLNDDASLEREADAMGAQAARSVQTKVSNSGSTVAAGTAQCTAPIQRLTGFEAEFSVPTMPAPPAAVTLAAGPTGQAATAAVEGFLTGGLPYGMNMGHNANFTLKPDHNVLQRLHRAIRTALERRLYVLPAMTDTMSNLEYVTPALDELAPNSGTAFQTQFTAIANHASALFPTVQNQMFQIPVPSGAYYTGIPLADLQAWLATDYQYVRAAVEAYRHEIRDSFYLQATVGIIPSALGDLHRSRTSWFAAGTVYQAMEDEIHTTVQALLSLPGFANSTFVIDIKRTDPIGYEALVGLLYMIFSYLVGSAVNQTNLFSGSSAKNTVAFMSKLTSLGDMMAQAAPLSLRGGLPTSLIRVIARHFISSPATTVGFWTGGTWGLAVDGTRGATIGDAATFVLNVLMGQPAWTAAATHATRSYANPDALPIAVAAASGNQGGVQVEYRHIMERPNTGGLSAELIKIVNEVRSLNTKHMGWFAKRTLVNAASQ